MTPSQVLDLVRSLLDLILGLVPAPVARQLLDDAAVKRANAIADAAEAAKFGPLAVNDLEDGDTDPPEAA